MQTLERLVEDGYAQRADVVRTFFAAEADGLAHLCHLLARRFIRGGRLIAFGVGAAATDAQHVSVEFVHPVIVGKRALPAMALVNDVATALGLTAHDPAGAFALQLAVLGGAEDIALGMVHGADDPGAEAVTRALERARSMGMLSVGLGASAGAPEADHVFAVASDDPFVVQEVHETLYHVLWELVHVFFDHKGLLEDRPRGSAHDAGRSSFLYPFLAEAESGLDAVLAEVRTSIVRKAEDVIDLRAASSDPVGLVSTAALIRERIDSGGKVLALGNGGSATDAQDLVADLVSPPPGLAPVAALSLTNDGAVVTAVGNDVGFENVFARQVIALGAGNDVAVAISTSGSSRNAIVAMSEARRRGMLTVALAGYGGGRLAAMCDRAHPIDADYIPRIQEAQASQYHLLRRAL
jgi:D-sedoheptulose 7-phosphate isomerase